MAGKVYNIRNMLETYDFSLEGFFRNLEDFKLSRYVMPSPEKYSITAIAAKESTVIYLGNAAGIIYKHTINNQQFLSADTLTRSLVKCLYLTSHCLISITEDGTIQIWNAQTMHIVSQYINKLEVSCSALSPDEKFVILGGKHLFYLDLNNINSLSCSKIDCEDVKDITAVCISHDLNYIFLGNSEEKLIKLSLCSKSVISKMNTYQEKLVCIRVNRRDSKVITLGMNGCIKMWNADDFKTFKVLGSHKMRGIDIDVSSDAKWAVSSGEENSIKIWSLDYLKEEIMLQFDARVKVCQFSGDNSKIICGKDNGEIEIISLEVEEEEISAVEASKHLISESITSYDNQYFVTGDEDGYVKIYKYPYFDLEYEFKHNNKILAIALSRDNQYLITSELQTNGKTQVNIWSTATQDLLDTIPDLKATSKSLFLTQDDRYIITKTDSAVIKYDRITRKIVDKLETGELIVGCMLLSHDNSHLITSNLRNTIKLWDFRTKSLQGELIGHKDVVNCLIVRLNHMILVSASEDGAIIFWHILKCKQRFRYEHQGSKVVGIELSEDNRFLYVAFSNGVLTISSLEEMQVIKKIVLKLDSVFTNMTICRHEDIIMFTSFKKFYYIRNPLHTDRITVNKQKYSALYLINLLKHKKCRNAGYNRAFNTYRVLPWNLNLLHVLAYSGNIRYIKSSMKDGINFSKMKDGKTALSICLKHNDKQCAEAIVKRLTKYNTKHQEDLGLLMEESILELLENYLPSVSRLFNISFPIVQNQGLVSYGRLRGNQVIFQDFDPYIEPVNFLISNSVKDSSSSEHLIFRQSTMRLNLELGSKESLGIIKALIFIEDIELFKTPLIQTILIYKWNQVKYRFILFNSPYLLYIICIILCLFKVLPNIYLMITLLLLNICITLYIALQLISDFSIFISHPINLIHIINVILTYYFTLSSLLDSEFKFTSQCLTVLLMITWMRFVSFFRIFSKTRYLIRVIQEVFKDLIPFTFIMITGCFAIALLFYIFNNLDLITSYVDVYLIGFGNSKDEMYIGGEKYIFILATFLVSLLLMNLLISILGDTYNRVQENNVLADGVELACLIKEVENFYCWRRRVGSKKYLQSCSYSTYQVKYSSNIMHGRVREIKSTLKSLDTINKKKEKTITKLDVSSCKSYSGIYKRLKESDFIIKTFKNDIKSVDKEIRTIKCSLESLRNLNISSLNN